MAERPQPRAVSVAAPPACAGLVTDTAAWGAAPAMTLTGVVGTLVSEPVQMRLATYAPGASSGVWKVTATDPSGRTAAAALPMARSSMTLFVPAGQSCTRGPAGWAGSQPVPLTTTVSKDQIGPSTTMPGFPGVGVGSQAVPKARARIAPEIAIIVLVRRKSRPSHPCADI